ncbi:MAG: YolD-like family protein [Bacilli bacterium]|nr:YolD-like family protein [Bacilli bacterium]
MLNSEEVLKKLAKEKRKINKPILSDEQIMLLEKNIIEYYERKDEITIIYYEAGQTKNIKGIITKLDPIKRKIIINDKISLYFSNILDIL